MGAGPPLSPQLYIEFCIFALLQFGFFAFSITEAMQILDTAVLFEFGPCPSLHIGKEVE